MTALLPPSTRRTERNAATTCAQAQALPIPLRTLWSPWNCPAHLLPYLAASWSVDRWDNQWPEATKRQVIANSYFVHSRKGTIGAIRRVVEPRRAPSSSISVYSTAASPKPCIWSWSG